MNKKEIDITDDVVRDEYGDILREKKDVPVLACLICLMKKVTLQNLKFTALEKAFTTPGNIGINVNIEKEIFSYYLMKYVLPEVADSYPEVHQACIPRLKDQANDIELAYYSSGMLPENFDRSLYLAKFATDLVLRNHCVPVEKRREILEEFETIALSPNENMEK